MNAARDSQPVGYKAKAFEPRHLAILFLITSVFPLLFFTPFILGLLPWPEGPAGVGGIFVSILMILLYTAPVIVPLVLTAITEGKPGIKALLGRFWKGKLSLKWLLIAALLWPAIFLVINLLARAMEGDATYPLFSFIGKPWTYFPSAFLGVLFIAIFEEFCWRGYALPCLQVKWNALTSSLILGVFWALMHLPNWFMPPGNPNRTDSFLTFAVQIILTSILYTWIFNNMDGNLLGVILAHNMSNVIGTLIQVPETFQTYQNWVILAAVVLVVIFSGPKNLVRQKPEPEGMLAASQIT